MPFPHLIFLTTVSMFCGCVVSLEHLKTINHLAYEDVLPLSYLQTDRGGGVIEPGRLLNIILGFVVILGFLLINTFTLIALGLAVGPTVQKSQTAWKNRNINHSLTTVNVERFFDMLVAYQLKNKWIKQ